jgi:hypothetical protein
MSKVVDMFDEDEELEKMKDSIVFEDDKKEGLTQYDRAMKIKNHNMKKDKRRKGSDSEDEEEEVEEEDEDEEEKKEKPKGKKKRMLDVHAAARLESVEFMKDYHKFGGIQHIICSATMTIDDKGRMTPRLLEKTKRLKLKEKSGGKIKGKPRNDKGKADKDAPESQMDGQFLEMCKVVKFRSKAPKIIDLTSEERMPARLDEKAIRCSKDEKDLYMYYYLQ